MGKLFHILSLSAGVAIASTGVHAATLTSQAYGTTTDGQAITQYTLSNKNGVSVSFLNFGGVITQIITPDAQGNKENIVLGYDNLHGYEVTDTEAGIHFGSLIGRYANRIGKGQFEIDGKTYQLETNDGPNTLHSGAAPKGYDKRVWEVKTLKNKGGTAQARLHLVSPEGDQGFPGKLDVDVIYSLNDQNQFQIQYIAKTTKPTVLNLTNHSYFNLAGVKNSPYGILDNILTINGNQTLETDAHSLPTGKLLNVANTPFDFRQAKPIVQDIRAANQQLAYGYGYDQTWVINGKQGALNQAVTVVDPKSKRTLNIQTTEPSVQFYTANHLLGNVAGRDGTLYRQADAFAFETQHFPDSPNQPTFPSTRLNPNQTFKSTTIYTFGVEK